MKRYIFDGKEQREVECTPEEEAEILARWAAGDAERAALEQKSLRQGEYDEAIAADATVSQLKAMTNAEFDAWWEANITTAAAMIAVFRRMARVMIRRLL